MVRVEIELPRFRGAGLYRTPDGTTHTLGPARVLVPVGIGNEPVFHGRVNVVTITQATATIVGGRLDAVLIGSRRTPFRAFGTWRCSITTRANFSRPVTLG
jgi:hypothetical protein